MPLTKSERNYLLVGIAIGFAVAANWSTLKKRLGPYMAIAWAKLTSIFGMASDDVARYFRSADEAASAKRRPGTSGRKRAGRKRDAGLDVDPAKIIEGLFSSKPPPAESSHES